MNSNIVTELSHREVGTRAPIYKPIAIPGLGLSDRLDNCKALYRKDLYCHYQCVNAIEFSPDGELLASGGDDKRVMLWKFGETLLDHGKPEQMETMHYLNIFCLAISPDNQRIYSGGHDDRVIIHDIPTKSHTDTLLHNKAVGSLSLDPFNSKIVATAGNDGRLLVFDIRYSVNESMVVSCKKKAFNSCVFHPKQSSLIAAANAKDGAALWDLRSPKHPVIIYGGTNGGVFHNCMSVCFNNTGTFLMTLRRRQPPVIYTLDSVDPYAHFYHPDYFNSCTMKSSCFAGPNDEYVVSGSDDFNVYMWKIPETPGGWVEQTHLILYGHKSIVNQVRYNPHSYILASSGVEKCIKIWSPVYLPGSTGSLSEEQKHSHYQRDIYSHEDYVSLVHNTGSVLVYNDYPEQSTVEDPRILALFDTLIQRDIERWSPEETDSQSDECPIFPPRNSNRNVNSIPLIRDSDDSSGSDQIVINYLKRASGILPNQRFPKRTRVNVTRYAKVSRIHQRGLISRRIQKLQRMAGRGTSSSSISRNRYTRTIKNRRGIQRGAFTHPPSVVNMISSVTESDADSDRPSSPMPLNRIASKMSRVNRRRMSITRNFKRKTRGYNGYALSREESSYSEDNLAVPSTSTGIRENPSGSLFRIVETNSDDDLSIDNDNLPSTSAASRPKRPRLNETTDDCETLEGGTETNNNSLSINIDTNYPQASTSWDNRDQGYSSVLTRLRNETNESEVESSYSTGSAAEPGSPRKLNTLPNPHNCGTSALPSSSNQSEPPATGTKRSEPDSTLKKQKCKMKRLKRNYRRQNGDSDTT